MAAVAADDRNEAAPLCANCLAEIRQQLVQGIHDAMIPLLKDVTEALRPIAQTCGEMMGTRRPEE
jgi:hypothetical protein